jgi:hypothetical protein
MLDYENIMSDKKQTPESTITKIQDASPRFSAPKETSMVQIENLYH